MSSDLFLFDDSSFTVPFSPLTDSAIDIFQPISHEKTTSSSAPTYQHQNLPLCQTTHLGNASNGYANFFSALEVKTEECQFPFYSSYGGSENMMQMSYSLMESPYLQTQVLTSLENTFSTGHVRRVWSTGDLHNIKTSHMFSSSPLATESSLLGDANSKIGRYSPQERKQRIHRYRAKRNHRNFNKTIKYACRKTLADNRPRIRGRFVRNDEIGEIPKAAPFNGYEDELWIEGFHEEEAEGRVGRGAFFNSYVPTQFQYYGY